MGCIRFLFSPFAFVFGAVGMALVMVIAIAVTTSTMGMAACFKDDTWSVTDTFGAIMLGAAFIGGIVGGAIARKSGGGLAVLLMAAFAAYISFVPHVDSPMDAGKSKRYEGRPESRPKDAGLLELVRYTDHPSWMRLGGAIVGVTGVVFGSSLAKGGRTSRSSGDDE